MFVGAVPLGFVAQILGAVPFGDWRGVFCCCSGSFRPEIALRQRYPELRIAGCDVSLLSVAIGELAAGREIRYRFIGRLAPLEKKIATAGPVDRVAAIVVAHEMAAYRGKNVHARGVFDHYLAQFDDFLTCASMKVVEILRGLGNYEFFAGDFRAHAARAAREGAGVLAFPPTYKNGYERLYKFLDDNVEWARPDYAIWDPADLDEWVRTLDEEGVRYCILADRRLGWVRSGRAV